MNNYKWIEHLAHWSKFLETRLINAEDEGTKTKVTRQIRTLERVRYSTAMNPKLLIEFIDPTPRETLRNQVINYFLDLNDSQKNAVNSVINGSQFLSLIQGPPGTGKTQVISEICLQLCANDPDIRILVCSETHVAVNNMINRIFETNPSIRCLRVRDKEQNTNTELFSPYSVINNYMSWLDNNCDDPDITRIVFDSIKNYEDKSLEKALALSANVVGMTCNRVSAYHFQDTTEMFDYAIIDEACKATLPEILMPLLVSNKAVLVGDPKQLPPVFCSEDLEIIKSIENCDLQEYIYINELFENTENTVLLDTQYRMENTIGKLISHQFYNDSIKNGRNIDVTDSLLWIDYLPSKMWPESNYMDNSKQIIRNLDECKIISEIINEIDKKSDVQREIGVIVPYRYQVNELKRTISTQSEKHLISIDTVDGFQGKECDIVIFGVTRTTGPFRFLADERRINVALSRAKNQIIIVGNKEYTSKNITMRQIGNACKTIMYHEGIEHLI